MPSEERSTPDWTPEQKAAVYERMKREFTVEMLLEYINVDGPVIPMEEVMRQADELLREIEARKAREAG